MNNLAINLLLFVCVFAITESSAQTIYSYAEEISFRESFHQNVKINEDSTLTYTKYNGDYSYYEEFEGVVNKQKNGTFKMELALRKRFESVERNAPFQFRFSIDTDSAYASNLQLNIWYFDDEEIPLQLKFPQNSNIRVDTIINIKASNGLLIYTPYWNPTNKDEIVHKVAWNRAPKWTINQSNQEKRTLYFKLEEGEIQFLETD